jgi:hypothetical protein
MNKVYLQIWQLCERNRESLPDGCSIHASTVERDSYIRHQYAGRNSDQVPDEYECAVGLAFEAYVEDSVYASLVEDGNVRIDEPSFRNLIEMEEIIIK